MTSCWLTADWHHENINAQTNYTNKTAFFFFYPYQTSCFCFSVIIVLCDYKAKHWYCYQCLYHHDFVFVVATEWTGVAQRSYGSCLSQVLASLGQVVFLALIYYYRNWRMCQFIMAGPIGFVVLYIWYVLENSSYWRNSSAQNGNVILNHSSHSCHPCFQTKISLVCACLLMGNISVMDVTFWVKTSECF